VTERGTLGIAIVGSGFSGLGLAARLRRSGRHDFAVLERGHEVGGTWRDNTYPGARCDTPSYLYSLSFAPNADWTNTYPWQPEIQAYLRRVADEEGLRPFIHLGEELLEAAWDEDERLWRLRTSRRELRARALAEGAGPLSEPSLPPIPGLADFPGTMFHSARWDHDHDLTGERVAVIGTGASGVQIVPEIQPQARRLHLFQRTPSWVMPHPGRRVSRLERALCRRVPGLLSARRRAIFLMRESLVLGLGYAPRLMAAAELIARVHLRNQVRDPELRAKLTPSYRMGCKRITASNDYLRALTRPNAEVVTAGISEVRGRTIVTADGVEREVDTIVLATGFHVTDMPIAHRVRGRAGRSLADAWDGSPQAHLGTSVAGFPNLFLLLGPNTGLGSSSVVWMIEDQIEYVLASLSHLSEHGLASIEPRAEAQAAWNAAIQDRAARTVWNTGGCASWYIDRNGRNTTLWPDFAWRFGARARSFVASDHDTEPLDRVGDSERALVAGA
jgi:cation diffusion facilitator CzcD-associated flavoprotein CzcO